jgi:hypothetical protein
LAVEAVIVAIMLFSTAGAVTIAVAMARRPGRFAAAFRERTWRRAMLWIVGLTVAAAIGALVGGGDAEGLVLLVGGVSVYVVGQFWALAWTFGDRD